MSVASHLTHLQALVITRRRIPAPLRLANYDAGKVHEPDNGRDDSVSDLARLRVISKL